MNPLSCSHGAGIHPNKQTLQTYSVMKWSLFLDTLNIFHGKTLQLSLPAIWFVLKQFWKTDFWTPLSLKKLNENKPVLVTIRYEDIFALCLQAITIYATIQYNIFSK